ncbi:MAG: single-stranded DNA-binding protein [Dissulfurispiraceae bacterium]
MYNKVIMMGNLTRTPEVRYIGANNTATTTLTLAMNTKYKAGSGDMKEEVLFLDCVLFGKAAETAAQYLTKGRAVHCEGRLRERKWETDGVKHSKMEMIVALNGMTFVPIGNGAKSNGQSAAGVAANGSGEAEEVTDLEPF